MEASGAGIGRLDCYEDMFKEITRKLYGDDPDHRTSNVQNEFEASVAFKAEEAFKADDDEAATEVSDDSWILDDEPLKGADGSRVAAYRAATSTWRCYECGDCTPGGAREAAEHFVDLHATTRLDESPARGRMHRKDHLAPSDVRLEEVVTYLERLRERGDRLAAAPTRRTQETQTVPAVLLPVSPSFLLQELAPTPPQQQLLQQQQQQQQASPVTSAPTTRSTTAAAASAGGGGNNASGKRYTCLYCPYGTDRRDLYTRHENIHREEKPFHCYVCYKPFSRADHVKKHFLRMHREHTYELSRIRKPVSSPPSLKTAAPIQPAPTPIQQHQQPQQPQQPPPPPQPIESVPAVLEQAASLSSAVAAMRPLSPSPVQAQQPRRLPSVAAKSQLKSTSPATSSKNTERRYTCCYCSWSGVDNWCLKRHLNTHLKPFACALCEYKAARAERLATHVLKVHNRRQCSRCSFLAEDLAQLQVHQLHVHRVGNPGASAASMASAAAAPHQQATTSASGEDQQPLGGAGGGGRAPPGPPVFPASSAAIAPATTVIPPTTILGDRASTPGSGCWEQEASSCEARFQPPTQRGPEHRRSRKQTTPRKVLTCPQTSVPQPIEWPPQPIEPPPPASKAAPGPRLLRCYQCPEHASARADAYHSRASLLLHKMWRHKNSDTRGPRRAGSAVRTIAAAGLAKR